MKLAYSGASFLLFTRYTRNLTLILTIGTVLSLIEGFLTLTPLSRDGLLALYLKSTQYTKYYYLFLLIAQIFFTSSPTSADVLNFFSLPIPKQRLYDSWALFQFISRFIFTSFMEGVLLLPLMNPLYIMFGLEFSVIGATLSSISMINRKISVPLYLLQVGVAVSVLWLNLSLVLSGLLALLSFSWYIRFRDRYDVTALVEDVFRKRDEKGEDKFSHKGLLTTRLLYPLVAFTFNASGQVTIIKPRFNGRIVLFITSLVCSVALFLFSHLVHGVGIYGRDFMRILIAITMYFSMLLQAQWIAVGTLAYERPWLLIEALGENKFIEEVNIANLANLSMSWTLIFLFSIFVLKSYLLVTILILPISWLIYLIIFPVTASAAPNLERVADGSQPYQTSVRNMFGLSIVTMIPFVLVDASVIYYEFSGNAYFMLWEALVISVVSLILLRSGRYKSSIMNSLSQKGYI